MLTTNFDQLNHPRLRAGECVPAVYDLTAFHPPNAHGRTARPGGVSCTASATALGYLTTQTNWRNTPKLKTVFDHARERRLWIVVGYSGEADPLLELIQAKQYENGLYWIGIEPSLTIIWAIYICT